MRKHLLLIACVTISSLVFAQKSTTRKFGKVTVEEIQPKVYSVDSSANAVILYDFGRSEIVGISKNWFSLEYTHHRIVHILKKSGYDIGEIEVPLYVDGQDEEKLDGLRAITYNLVDGKLVETKMEKAAVFTDKKDKHHLSKKFTLPNIKEGSIIEYEYKVTSDFLFALKPWVFQGQVPRLWSEYQLTIPEFMGYVFLKQGYLVYNINERKDRQEQFRISDNRGTGATEVGTLNANVSDYRWVIKDVPELKEEGFTSTLRNHVSKVEFQLSEFRYPLNPRQIMRNWPQATKDLLESESFGKNLSTNNGWLADDLKPLLVNASSSLEKAKIIYAYVRDNFVCQDHYALQLTQSLKNVMKNKKGSVSEINLLLTAMLRYADIEASPVILSTRENGYAYELYPVINQFNYVVSQARVDGESFCLDASHPRLGFGKMPSQCYNGWARIINETSKGLHLSSDSLKERKLTSLILIDDNGKWTGTFTQNPGYYESYNLRNKIKENGEESVFKAIQNTYGSDAKAESSTIDSLKHYDLPLTLRHRFSLQPEKEDIIYVNPLFGEAKKENPFKSAERFYPVEMPYPMDETYVATIYVPQGYEIEEIPKQIMVRLNEKNEGMFEYAIGASGNIISLRSRIKLTRTIFAPEEYEMLREFFNLIVKKHSEQIVFKKKK